MRRQAFLPEAPARLEGRCLPSSPRAPSVFPGPAFGSIVSRMRADFGEYAYSRNLPQLLSQLRQVVVKVPFGRVDGLGGSIDGILGRMRQGEASGAPRPVAGAYKEAVATVSTDVQARIDDGSLVIAS